MTETIGLNYHAVGEGPPLVILHGLFGSARNWQTFAQKMAEQFRVLAVDLRNHGNSPHHSKMTYAHLAADVVRVLDDEGYSSATIIGHSMGGKTAMKLALDFPDRVTRLIIVDIAPVAYEHNYNELLGSLRSLDLNLIKRRSDANRLLSEALDDDELRLFLLQNLVMKAHEPSYWRINLEAIRDNIDHLVAYQLEPDADPYEGPVDLIRGADSNYVLDAYFPTFERYFPKFKPHTISGAGHWPHAQKPNEFLACVKQIVSR